MVTFLFIYLFELMFKVSFLFRKGANLAGDDFEWLDADNNKILAGTRLMRYQVNQNEKQAIKLRIDWSFNDTKYEIKLKPCEFLDTYERHWSAPYDPATATSTEHHDHHVHHQIGHFKSNSSLVPGTTVTSIATSSHHIDLKVDIDVSGGVALGYYRLTCVSGKLEKNKAKIFPE